MEEGSQGRRPAGRPQLRLIPGGPTCTFCGGPEGRPLHGLPDLAVCEDCLRTACTELLHDHSLGRS